MHRHLSTVEIALVIGLAIAVVILPGCKRAQEETEPVSPPQPPPEPIESLELPQTNTMMGITLNSVPDGLVATYNEDLSIEVADISRPVLRYTFRVGRDDLPARTPASLVEFRSFIDRHNQGKVADQGRFDSGFGEAEWAVGEYFEEEQWFEDLRVFVRHPTGDGTLVITATSPRGTANVDEQVSTIQELLDRISQG
jgi:hypothetical protein